MYAASFFSILPPAQYCVTPILNLYIGGNTQKHYLCTYRHIIYLFFFVAYMQYKYIMDILQADISANF